VTEPHSNAAQGPAYRRAEQRHRRRALIALGAFALAYTIARFTWMGDLRNAPYQFNERASWWLPKDG
jgi:hypothetical protein